MSERTLLLGVDTSTEGDLALAELYADGTLTSLGSQQFSGRQQSTELVPKLRLLLSSAGVTLADIKGIIVVSGPGTFTGLRIGISAAKGLAEAARIPLIAVSSLAAMSSKAAQEDVVVLTAGRTEYYVRSNSHVHDLAIESLETESTIDALTHGKAVLISEEKLADRFPAAASVTVEKSGAWQAIVAALPRFAARDFDDAATLDANYVRRPYTEMAKPVS
jgi:tRNA threonylcarbamoyladenosine biosynthesis protein TsaB